MRVRTAYRISVDSFGFDAFTPGTLDRVIDTKHNWTRGYKPADQQPEQDTTRLAATSTSTTQNTVIIHEAMFLAVARNSQATRDCALAWSRHCSYQQYLRLLPDTIGKQRCKSTQ
jgi:hypothetical protein